MNYELNPDGTIRNPGKFEGEMWYIPELWDNVGDAEILERDGYTYFYMELTPEGKHRFHIDDETIGVILHETTLGFVTGIHMDASDIHKLRTECEINP